MFALSYTGQVHGWADFDQPMHVLVLLSSPEAKNHLNTSVVLDFALITTYEVQTHAADGLDIAALGHIEVAFEKLRWVIHKGS